jgi:hypothetical protein
MRRVRRNVNQIGRDMRWVQSRLQREADPEVVAELRALLAQMMAEGAIKPSGHAFQESRLPKPNGPPDCWLCQVIGGEFVPKYVEREFESLLSQGWSPERAWEQIEERDKVKGKGRGFVALQRFRHEDHAEVYRKGSAKFEGTESN